MNIQNIQQRYKKWLIVHRENSNSTVKQMLYHNKKFLEWLKEKELNIDDVDQNIIDEYIGECKEKYSHNTLVALTANLRKFLRHYLNKDLIIKIPQIKPPKRDKTPLTKEEVEAIFREAEEDILAYAVLKVLYYTGIRRNELRNLDIEDVDFERLQLRIKKGKGDTYGVVNMTKDCAMAIKRWIEVRPKPKEGHEKALFISIKRNRISNDYIYATVKRYAAKAGIKKPVYPHKFRITMITQMAEEGVPPKLIQAQSRHNSMRTLLGYMNHIDTRAKEMYNKVFEKDEMEVIDTANLFNHFTEEYKKKAFKKYLDGEIDINTLNSILLTIEGEERNIDKKTKDIAYM